ncbi:MAG TPA: peptide-methionine (R)-S-oxide reductase MsrB [Pirellulales bacterium]|nr:peptide-methionine (R)-S-oxide reductase MsrB [Pirellulales bacterium]
MLRRSMCATTLGAVLMTVLMISPSADLFGRAKPRTPKSAAPDDRPTTSEEKADAGQAKPGEQSSDKEAADENQDDVKPVRKSDREWKRLLTAKQYRVARQKETELPFSGKYVHTKKDGVYRCVCCGAKLFDSDTKFDSGTGWPSFYAPVREKAIAKARDYSDGTPRMEVTCARCDAHLGHVFGDGPEPTGLRYCINSVCLKLDEAPAPKTSKKTPQK